MNRSLAAQSRFFDAVSCGAYDLGVFPRVDADGEEEPKNREFLSVQAEKIMSPAWQHQIRKANQDENAAVFIRPARAARHGYVFLDDFDAVMLEQMQADGRVFAAIVESSPKNFQGWIDVGRALDETERKVLQRRLQRQYDLDAGSVSGGHYGRLPGFTNRKPAYLHAGGAEGLFPWVLLRSTSTAVDYAIGRETETPAFRAEVEEERQKQAPSLEIGAFTTDADAQAAFLAARAALTAQHAGDIDLSRQDCTICRRMLSAGYPPEAVAGTLEAILKKEGRSGPGTKHHNAGRYVRLTISAASSSGPTSKTPPPAAQEEEPRRRPRR